MRELSAVVCTHERSAELASCLESLVSLNADIQVIVVDSGSAVPCEQLVESYRDRLADLRYVYVDLPGLSRARNAGIAAADGSLIAFLDDDARPQEGWAQALLGAFAAHPSAGCVGGACVARLAGPPPRWLSERLLQLSSITRWGEEPRQPRSSSEWPFGANLAFRRSTLKAVGPFSVELGRSGVASLRSGEDSDMIARVLAAGFEVWLEPRCKVLHVVHPERLSSRWYWRRLWWAGISRAQNPSLRSSSRLALAAPLRLALWVGTRDRIYLYRLAESAGYFSARLRPKRTRA